MPMLKAGKPNIRKRRSCAVEREVGTPPRLDTIVVMLLRRKTWLRQREKKASGREDESSFRKIGGAEGHAIPALGALALNILVRRSECESVK